MTYTVKQLAQIAGVSIRTIHYYDEIGLLEPAFIKDNGYRSYGEKELVKLQQIMFFRELEFPLEDILQMVNAKDFNPGEALGEQRRLLELKRKRLNRLIKTIDNTVQNLKGGEEKMDNNQMFDSFDMAEIDQYKEEAKQRWGNTEAYKQSQERTKNWTKEDYKRIAAEGKKFNQLLADMMDKGFNSPEFQDLIQKHYEGIEVFYDCSLEMYRTLGDMYVADPRFTATYDKFRPGLARVMQQAINYYCDQHAAK
jgi:DNA-binding transcriptional MerR regulator